MARKSPSVFISHAQADHAVADHLSKSLTARGVRVVDDRQLGHGDDFLERVEAEIKAADLIFLLVSPHYLASQWSALEAGIALGQKALDRRVVSILLGGITPESVSRLVRQTLAVVAAGMSDAELVQSLEPIVSQFLGDRSKATRASLS